MTQLNYKVSIWLCMCMSYFVDPYTTNPEFWTHTCMLYQPSRALLIEQTPLICIIWTSIIQ